MKQGYSRHQYDSFFKPLSVGAEFKFTEYNPGKKRHRIRKFAGNVLKEYQRFYLVKIGASNECILKNDLYTQRYVVERM